MESHNAMKKLILIASFIFFSNLTFSQADSFEQWDKNYQEIDLAELLSFEEHYADSIENNFGDTQQLYFRADKYRFSTTFTGNWRKISEKRKTNMNFVFKMIGVDQKITKSIRNEVELAGSYGQIWMPIQSQLEKPFKKEVKANTNVYIYVFFLNLHNSKGLDNILLVSEFISGDLHD